VKENDLNIGLAKKLVPQSSRIAHAGKREYQRRLHKRWSARRHHWGLRDVAEQDAVSPSDSAKPSWVMVPRVSRRFLTPPPSWPYSMGIILSISINDPGQP
jgi:hypothetical protein